MLIHNGGSSETHTSEKWNLLLTPQIFDMMTLFQKTVPRKKMEVIFCQVLNNIGFPTNRTKFRFDARRFKIHRYVAAPLSRVGKSAKGGEGISQHFLSKYRKYRKIQTALLAILILIRPSPARFN